MVDTPKYTVCFLKFYPKSKIAFTPKDNTHFPENINKIFSETILLTELLQCKNVHFVVFC